MPIIFEKSRPQSGPETYPAGGMIIRQREPENLEFRFETLRSFLTPMDEFYVRCHFPQPDLDAKTWRLHVEGEVINPLQLTFDDLREMPTRSITAVLECAGNNRVFLTPKAIGVPWELGAVSNAEWTGVSLKSVVEHAGLKPGATEVIFEGADSGQPSDEPKNPEQTPFARSLPLQKALDPDVLLAFEMNQEQLTRAHGFPVRLIVPDYYAMASIKWLARIIVTDKPFTGYYQSFEYAIFEPSHGIPSLTAVGEMEPKAQIARPMMCEVIPTSSEYRVHGAAWGGCSPIAKVEVSVDAGRHWQPAHLFGDSVPHAWRLWEFEWRTPSQPCSCTLMARASDEAGRVQPLQRQSGRLNSLISHVLPIEIEVK